MRGWEGSCYPSNLKCSALIGASCIGDQVTHMDRMEDRGIQEPHRETQGGSASELKEQQRQTTQGITGPGLEDGQ